jgi:hypothetical protein
MVFNLIKTKQMHDMDPRLDSARSNSIGHLAQGTLWANLVLKGLSAIIAELYHIK